MCQIHALVGGLWIVNVVQGRYAPGSSCRPRVTNKTVQQIKLSPTKKFGPGSIADNLGQAFEENQLNL